MRGSRLGLLRRRGVKSWPGRLLLVSPFLKKHRRVTAELATERNRFVAGISDDVLVPYAAPGGKTEALALNLLASGKRVYTFNDRPSLLLEAGAQVIAERFFAAITYSGSGGAS
jgi:predicted Rossmann fold nucleotide-binding protein DprA/Smf involved in DNA uptake